MRWVPVPAGDVHSLSSKRRRGPEMKPGNNRASKRVVPSGRAMPSCALVRARHASDLHARVGSRGCNPPAGVQHCQRRSSGDLASLNRRPPAAAHRQLARPGSARRQPAGWRGGQHAAGGAHVKAEGALEGEGSGEGSRRVSWRVEPQRDLCGAAHVGFKCQNALHIWRGRLRMEVVTWMNGAARAGRLRGAI